MSIFSNLVNYCSEAAYWAKNNPGQAIVLTSVAILSGGLVGYAIGTYGFTALATVSGGMINIANASASVSTGIITGIAVGSGIVINGLNNGLESQADKAKIKNLEKEKEDYLKENLRDQLNTEKKTNVAYENTTQHNAQTIKEQQEEIIRLQTELAKKQTQAQPQPIPQVRPEEQTQPTQEPTTQEPSAHQAQSMFTNTGVRQRVNRRNAANDPVNDNQARQGM